MTQGQFKWSIIGLNSEFRSLRLVATPMLKSPVYSGIAGGRIVESLSQGIRVMQKGKQPHPRFQLRSTSAFPIMITITPRVPQ